MDQHFSTEDSMLEGKANAFPFPSRSSGGSANRLVRERMENMHNVSRRSFVKSAVGASIVPILMNKTAAASPVAYEKEQSEVRALTPFDYNGVRLLDGMHKKQYLATRDNFFNLPNDDLLLGFRKRAGLPAPGNELPGYSRDVGNAFGQWLSAMARMYRATGDKPLLEKATYLLSEWAKTIEPDGYFFYSRRPFPRHYTYDKAVCSLVDLYHYAGQKEALGHLDKITDWAIHNLDRSRPNATPNDPGGAGPEFKEENRLAPLEWYTTAENLYRAYQLTGNSKYKTFGDVWRYPNYWDMFTSDAAEPTPPYRFHAYSHCLSLNGAAMAYAVTGEPNYLKTIVNAYDWLERTQLYATGGYGPGEILQQADGSLGKSLESTTASFETPCGTWAGFKLAKYLMQFTGEARYGDWIEKLVYNGIGAALPMSNSQVGASLPTPGRGQTFYYSDYKLGGARKVYFPGPRFPCCAGTYPQAVVDYHDLIYFKDPTSLYVNLFVPSQVTWNHEGNEIKVEQETSYPEEEITTLHIRPARSSAFNLKFRVPAWCQGMSFEVNGSKQNVAARPGTWATLQRRWNSGDLVKVRIPMAPRFVPIDKQHPDRVAVAVGPVVLVRQNESKAAVMERDLSKLLRTGGALEYRVQAQANRPFVPFYRVGEGALYGMYFDLQT
jgi:DUF1680 family protein